MKPVADGSHSVPHPLAAQTLLQEGQIWMELVVSNVLSTPLLIFRFMREDQAWLAKVVFACLPIPLYTHVHEHKAWMAAGTAHSRSHLDTVSQSSKAPCPLTFCYRCSFAQSLLLSTTLLTSKEAGSSIAGPSWPRPGFSWLHPPLQTCRTQASPQQSVCSEQGQLSENAL